MNAMSQKPLTIMRQTSRINRRVKSGEFTVCNSSRTVCGEFTVCNNSRAVCGEFTVCNNRRQFSHCCEHMTAIMADCFLSGMNLDVWLKSAQTKEQRVKLPPLLWVWGHEDSHWLYSPIMTTAPAVTKATSPNRTNTRTTVTLLLSCWWKTHNTHFL